MHLYKYIFLDTHSHIQYYELFPDQYRCVSDVSIVAIDTYKKSCKYHDVNTNSSSRSDSYAHIKL